MLDLCAELKSLKSIAYDRAQGGQVDYRCRFQWLWDFRGGKNSRIFCVFSAATLLSSASMTPAPTPLTRTRAHCAIILFVLLPVFFTRFCKDLLLSSGDLTRGACEPQYFAGTSKTTSEELHTDYLSK
jgi:hypothetical protein